jgi:hypothetical protein
MTADAKIGQNAYQWEARAQWRGSPLTGPLRIAITLYFGRRRSGDLDNFHPDKSRCLTGIVHEDDSQIDELMVRRGYDKQRPRIEPEVESMAVPSRCRRNASIPILIVAVIAGGLKMDFQHVRYFLALFEECNFSRAAKRCGVSQPSLTVAIQRLEASLGGPLFERHPSGSEPTALAVALKPQFDQIIEASQKVRAKAVRLTGQAPSLR